MRTLASLVFCLALLSTGQRADGADNAQPPSRPSLAFATYVGEPSQESAAAMKLPDA
jgi:hypothetical protein